MTRPHGLLRAGYPYSTTLGMRRVTNFPTDIAFGKEDILYVLLRSEGVATIRIWSRDDMEELTDDLKGFGSFGSEFPQLHEAFSQSSDGILMHTKFFCPIEMSQLKVKQ